MEGNNFYSIDRLIEFGMSMAVAQQMILSMNQTMTNMHVPGAMNKMETEPIYYAVVEGDRIGPLNSSEILKLIESKTIDKQTYMWKPGLTNWLLVEQLPEILKLVALTPPPLPKK